MNGLLEKDFRLTLQKKQLFVVYILMGIVLAFNLDDSWIVSFFTMLGSMLGISTLSYDEYENGYTFFVHPVHHKEDLRPRKISLRHPDHLMLLDHGHYHTNRHLPFPAQKLYGRTVFYRSGFPVSVFIHFCPAAPVLSEIRPGKSQICHVRLFRHHPCVDHAGVKNTLSGRCIHHRKPVLPRPDSGYSPDYSGCCHLYCSLHPVHPDQHPNRRKKGILRILKKPRQTGTTGSVGASFILNVSILLLCSFFFLENQHLTENIVRNRHNDGRNKDLADPIVPMEYIDCHEHDHDIHHPRGNSGGCKSQKLLYDLRVCALEYPLSVQWICKQYTCHPAQRIIQCILPGNIRIQKNLSDCQHCP